MGLTLDAETQNKLVAFKAQLELSVGEVVAVYWPQPDGTIYYGSTDLTALPNFKNILGHIPAIQMRLPGRSFENVVLTADVSDERVNLNFWDGDGEITRLFRTHGEGVRVEMLYFFPQLDWLVAHWHGHLQPPGEVDLIDFKTSAASGFRSAGLPLPHRIYQRPCQNQFPPTAPLLTQPEINESGCPYNRHIGGAVGNLDPLTGQPYLRCGKSEAECIARLNDKKSHTGFNTTVAAVAISTHGQTTYAASKGNETTLKEPIRVLYGGPRIVRSLDLLAYRQEHNTAHPDQGFLAAQFSVGEGPLRSMSACSINNALVGAAHLNTRLGAERQPATAYAPDVSNFNFTALFFGRIGPLNPGSYNASNITGQCTVEGIANIRVYSTPTAYLESYTDLRSWCLLNLYHKWRYGHGVDINRFEIQDWIDLAALDAQTFSFTDPNGGVWSGPRGKFSADLQGRSAQEQITDICKFGRYTMPFQHLGKIRILPLVAEDLENAPVFTDEGEGRNILRTPMNEREKPNLPRLSWSRQSDAVLPNELLITFEDAANGNIERPQTFADEHQQLRASRAYGDSTLRIVRKVYSAVGLSLQAQVARIGWLLYHLGEFDTGGTENNYQVKMYVTFQSGFPLYQSQVIKIDSELVRRSSPTPERPQGFTYFRVMKKTRQPDLSYEVICQAYPEDYYEALEVVVPPAADDYEAEDVDNTLTGGAAIVADLGCSGGAKVTGLGNGATIRWNGVVPVSAGSQDLTIFYKSTANMEAYISVNGGAALRWGFPSTNGAVGIQTLIRPMVAGANTVTLSNPTGPVPDMDKLTIERHQIEPTDPGGGTCRVTHEDLALTDDEISFRIRPPLDCL